MGKKSRAKRERRQGRGEIRVPDHPPATYDELRAACRSSPGIRRALITRRDKSETAFRFIFAGAIDGESANVVARRVNMTTEGLDAAVAHVFARLVET